MTPLKARIGIWLFLRLPYKNLVTVSGADPEKDYETEGLVRSYRGTP